MLFEIRVDIQEIFLHLKNYKARQFLGNPEIKKIESFKFYKKSYSIISDNILFIIKASWLEQIISPNLSGNFLCLEDQKISDQKLINSSSNYIVISDNGDIRLVLDKINEILEEKRISGEHLMELMKLQSQQASIQKLLDKASQILGNPVYLDEIGPRFIACSYNEKTDALALSQIQSIYEKKYGEYIYYKYKDSRDMEELYKSREPFYFREEAEYPAYILIGVFIDNIFVAGLSVFEVNRKFTKLDYQFVTMLSNIVSIELKKNSADLLSKNSSDEVLITNMLRESNSYLIEDQIQKLNSHLKQNKAVILISIPENERYNTGVDFIRTYLMDVINRNKLMNRTVIYGNSIVVILTSNREISELADVYQALKEFLSRNRLLGGVSRSFKDLKDLREHYDQALKAIECGRFKASGQVLYFYDQHATVHFLSICARNNDIRQYCHQSIVSLIKYDKRNSTQLTQFLYVYLKNKKNQMQTANALNLNRNTISMRLEKLETLFNINLADEEIIFHLKLSFKILEYLGDVSKDDRENKFLALSTKKPVG